MVLCSKTSGYKSLKDIGKSVIGSNIHIEVNDVFTHFDRVFETFTTCRRLNKKSWSPAFWAFTVHFTDSF